MSCRSTFFLFIGALLLAAYMNGGIVSSPPAARQTPVSATLDIRKGQRIPLEKAGIVLWSGTGLPGGVLQVWCAANGIAIGQVGSTTIALNGTTASLADRADLVIGAARYPISKADMPTMVGLGLVTAGSDPMIMNARISEGRFTAESACR